MTLKDLLGYLFCAAGIGLFICTWWASLGWGWGVLAVVLFIFGYVLLRQSQRGVAERLGDAVDAVIDVVDID